MSLRNKFFGLAGVCSLIAGAACAAPTADAATCNPCTIGPPVRLSIQGSQNNHRVIAYYGGGDQVDWQFFPFLGPPTEPPVTFLANDGTFQSTVPLQVQATDTLSCVSDTGGSPRTFKWFHYSAVEEGSASETYLPRLDCPAGYSVWASDQDAAAVDIYGHATAIAAFNWGPYGN